MIILQSYLVSRPFLRLVSTDDPASVPSLLHRILSATGAVDFPAPILMRLADCDEARRRSKALPTIFFKIILLRFPEFCVMATFCFDSLFPDLN